MAQQMTAEESARLEEFLKPSRIAVVATVGRTGMPHLTPNWYVYVDGKVAISTTKERLKYRNLMRDHSLSVCIYSEPQALEYVTVVGQAEIIDDESIWPVTRSIVERYVEAASIEDRMRRLREESRIIISLAPERVHFRAMTIVEPLSHA